VAIRLNLCGLLLLIPVAVSASEAMIYAAVYECDAEAVNQDLVEACSSQYPELSTHASAAFAKWRSRNSIKANLAKEACAVDLQEKAKHAPASEIDLVRKLMADTRANIRNDFQARFRNEGKRACAEALGQLEAGGGAMDFK
jgi:hypothetical protein